MRRVHFLEDTCEGLYAGYGLGEANVEVKSILNILAAFDFTIANTYFRKQ